MSRRHYATRWDEDNCQVQCYSCNVMRYGEQYKFGLRLAKEKELDLPEKLLAKTRKITKFSDVDIKEMIDLYKEKVRVL
jgi:hypothetical protein